MERRLGARRLDCPLIFHRGGRPMGDFRKTWATACGLALTEERGGKAITRLLPLPYDLRRTAVRNMVRAGVAEHVAMSISGHRTRNVCDPVRHHRRARPSRRRGQDHRLRLNPPDVVDRLFALSRPAAGETKDKTITKARRA